MTEPAKSTPTVEKLIANSARAAAEGNLEDARTFLNTALQLAPHNAALFNELGVIHYQGADLKQAKACFQRATELDPRFVRALINLGACFNEEKDNDNAIACYKKALAIAPDAVDAWGNMAKAWSESEEFEMAVYCYRRALELKPRTEFKRGLAKAYRKAGRYDRSEQLLREVLAETPEDADAHYGLALTLFHEQKYREATAEFVWRMDVKDMVQHRKDLHPIFNAPAYNGEDLANKTLLIHTEQGFGDNLQFARFINLVRPQVKKLVMWCRPGLAKLFHHSLNIDAISENVFKLPEFDYQLPLLSIPTHFDPELKSLDNFTPYLSAIRGTQTITRLNSLNIGLVWGASDSGFDHANKKVPLQLIKPLLDIGGICWHSLQVGSDRQDLLESTLNHPIIDHGDQLTDFMATANIIDQLDLVISCDTSVAHLAGAMGKPVWVMLKKIPDWRWLSDGETTPWYPSARLYRQANHGDWSSIVKRMTRDLAAVIREKESQSQATNSDDSTMPTTCDHSPTSPNLVENPQDEAPNYYQLGNQALKAGRFNEAIALYESSLKINHKNYYSLNNLGLAQRKNKQFKEAIANFDLALKLKPQFPRALFNKGNTLRDLGLHEEAIECYKCLLGIEPNHVLAYNNMGLAYKDLQNYGLAIECYDHALAIDPNHADTYYNRAFVFLTLKQFDKAMDDYKIFTLAKPDNATAFNNLGIAQLEKKFFDEAIDSFKKAITLQPRSQKAYYNLANTFLEKKEYSKAITFYKKSIELDPMHAFSYNNMGVVYKDMRNHEEAIQCYEKAIALQPNHAEAYYNKGNELYRLKRYYEAEISLRQALDINPSYGAAAGRLTLTTARNCDWSLRDQDQKSLIHLIESDIDGISPFAFLNIDEEKGKAAKRQKQCGYLYAEKSMQVDRLPKLVEKLKNPHRDRLSIGYISCDFYEHATMHLLEGVLKCHDKKSFKISAYSYSAQDDHRTEKVRQYCDAFIPITDFSDYDAAQKIACDGIDILVDLKGYTKNSRLGITAMHPAPIIVSWLGYPGTLGHPRLADYIIGDRIVTPLDNAADFSETIVQMPHCYQPNDSNREIGKKPSRGDVGLPEDGFVFCSFSAPYKISPQAMNVWCKLLAQIPGSVLWLLEATDSAKKNLIKEAQQRGIKKERLIFAPLVNLKEHLGRLQLADLALDTFPVTSHTTASDALWAGVPLIALKGETFVSRVSSSLLNTLELPELITNSWDEYLQTTLSFVSNPQQLKLLKLKLKEKIHSSPLFNTEKFTQDLETIYLKIWRNHNQ